MKVARIDTSTGQIIEIIDDGTPDPTYTASEWVNIGFGEQRPTTLLYLKLRLDAAQLVSPKLNAVQEWLDGMIVAGVTAPDERRSDWEASPWSFEEASGEALAVLAGQSN